MMDLSLRTPTNLIRGHSVGLSREEQETIINLLASDEEASIYTCDPVWMRKLAKLADKAPESFLMTKQTENSVEYTCPKKCVSIHTPRKTSQKQKETARKNMAKLQAARKAQIEE